MPRSLTPLAGRAKPCPKDGTCCHGRILVQVTPAFMPATKAKPYVICTWCRRRYGPPAKGVYVHKEGVA